MKTMTCKQLGGACEMEFRANTFEAIAVQSRRHGRMMFEKGDAAHTRAKKEMERRMQSEEEMQQWMEKKRMEFEALPEDKR